MVRQLKQIHEKGIKKIASSVINIKIRNHTSHSLMSQQRILIICIQYELSISIKSNIKIVKLQKPY